MRPIVGCLAVAWLVAAGMAAAQQRQPLGAYPPGMQGGQVPLGTYPSNRPPVVPGPAEPPPAPPAMTDHKADYCARNPSICGVREPDAHDYAVDRQKAFEQRMRDPELERGRR